jgi:hypothetical protein
MRAGSVGLVFFAVKRRILAILPGNPFAQRQKFVTTSF